jgi:tetratricopeptide (TPR) repeat protein
MIERVRQSEADGWEVPFEITPTAIRANGGITSDLNTLHTPGFPVERLAALTELMKRPFLDAIRIPGSFTSWLEHRRSEHRLRLQDLLKEARDQAQMPSDWLTVREGAKLLIEHGPADSVLTRILMEAHERITGMSVLPEPRSPVVDLPSSQRSADLSPVELPRLVLLPPTSDDDGVAAALIEDITIGLCNLRTVAVVAPYTAAKIRSHPDKVAQLVVQKISYVVDTRMSGEGLFAQMVFLPDDSVLWAERFSLKKNALVARRKEVARLITTAIAKHLRTSLNSLADYQAQPEVYRSYLLSAKHLSDYTLPGMRRARKAFKETLKLRDDFAPALAGLSRTFSWEWVLTARGDVDLLRQAEVAARSAVSVAPGSAVVHRELGHALLYRGDVDASLASFEEAEALSPHLADALCGYADALVHSSRPEEGLQKIQKAMALNPMSPDEYFWIAAGASYFLGKYQDAISYIGNMSNSASARRLLAASYAMSGDASRANAHRRKAQEMNPDFDVDKWLSVLPVKESWQKELYREGLIKAGF